MRVGRAMIRDDDYYEQIEEDRARRFAANAVCAECGDIGGHLRGCPAEPDEDDEDEDE